MNQQTLPPLEPAAGADPLAWAQNVQQRRAAGQLSDSAYAHYAPGLEKAFTSAAAPAQRTPEQSSARMEELRQLRIAGKCTDAQWREFEALASGGQAPQSALSIDQQLEAQIDQMMSGAQPHEYAWSYPPGFEHDDATLAFDSSVRTAFAAAGVPRHLAAPIFEGVDRVVSSLSGAPPEAQRATIGATTEQLRQRWGSDFAARIDAIDELVATATAASPQLAELFDANPWMLADVGVMLHLDTIARHRGSRRK